MEKERLEGLYLNRWRGLVSGNPAVGELHTSIVWTVSFGSCEGPCRQQGVSPVWKRWELLIISGSSRSLCWSRLCPPAVNGRLREKSGQLAAHTLRPHCTSYLELERYWTVAAWVFKAALLWTRWAQGAMEQDQGWLAELQVRPAVIASLRRCIATDSLSPSRLPHLHNTCHTLRPYWGDSKRL